MNQYPHVKKLMEVSEDALPPVHMPVFIDGLCFIVTYQDARRVEDLRSINYSRLMPNGQVIPMEQLGYDAQAHNAILQAFQQQQNFHQVFSNLNGVNPTPNFNQLIEIMGRNRGGGNDAPVSMEVDDEQSVTNPIEQQLLWSKVPTSPPRLTFPLHYTKCTSTTEIPYPSFSRERHCQISSNCRSRGCNTSDNIEAGRVTFASSTTGQKNAWEQLKERKQHSSTVFNYIS